MTSYGAARVSSWSEWLPFPDPRLGGYLVAPFGPGVYELRNKETGELVLFGSGKNVAYRMSSLLPHPLGQGTRNNSRKRDYVLQHLEHLEYRTAACRSESEAKSNERQTRDAGRAYIFGT